MKKTNFEPCKGKDNKRIDTCKPTNRESTAAIWSGESLYKEELVSKPSIDKVIDAKEWVDDGSKL